MPLDRADARDFGLPANRRRGARAATPGLACELLQSGIQLDIPRMLATLFLIILAAVAPIVFMVVLSKLALGQWHESEIGADA
jgi:NitT/TauT family transport system permease protein